MGQASSTIREKSSLGREAPTVADTAMFEVGAAGDRRREGRIGGVAPGHDADERLSRGEAGGVVDVPAPVLERLEEGVEVHGGEPGGVDGREPRRHAGGPAQGDAEMGEVAAGAHTGEEGVLGGVMDTARPGHVADALPDPVRDGGHPRHDVRPGPELGDGKTDQVVARAIAARSQVDLALVVGCVACGAGVIVGHAGLEPGPVGHGETSGKAPEDVHSGSVGGTNLGERRGRQPVGQRLEGFFDERPGRDRRRHLEDDL